jgi:hypothetical protein
MNSQSLRSEPFLWIHLTGIAVFPIFVELTIAGLSMGDSYPLILELPLIIGITVLPVLLMQIMRPFDIFSILFVSLKPESLRDRQKAILSLFQTFKQKLFSAIAAVMMMVLLWLLYRLSPLAIGIVDFLPQQRILGLAIATVGFLGSNLFLQIPLSVLLVLLTKQSKLSQTSPYPVDKILQDFTMAGIKINKILWFLESETDSLETT